MSNNTSYQVYYSPFPKLEGFLIKKLAKVYPYVVGYMISQPNLLLIIYNEFLYSTLVEFTLIDTEALLSQLLA